MSGNPTAGESRCTCSIVKPDTKWGTQFEPYIARCQSCISQDAEIARISDALKVAVEALEYTAMIRGSASAPVAKKALSTIKALGGERK